MFNSRLEKKLRIQNWNYVYKLPVKYYIYVFIKCNILKDNNFFCLIVHQATPFGFLSKSWKQLLCRPSVNFSELKLEKCVLELASTYATVS